MKKKQPKLHKKQKSRDKKQKNNFSLKKLKQKVLLNLSLNKTKTRSTKKSSNVLLNQTNIAMGLILFMSCVLVLSSFFKFESSKKISPEVKGLKADSSINYIPTDGVINNEDKNNNTSEVTYSTRLSKDQVDNFYDSLATMNGWEKIEYAKYKCSSGEFTYVVNQGESEKNIVAYTYCSKS